MDFEIKVATAKSESHRTNEDSFYIGDGFLIIADGMGGECDGDLASKMAVDTAVELFEDNLWKVSSESDVRTLSFNAIKLADQKIFNYIINNPGSFGMGTTILIVVKKDDNVYVSWCGDSRCYVFTKGCLKSITKDHSYVQELIDSGQISEQQSYTHPDNNLITRYVGGNDGSCLPDFAVYKMLESDILILCSDGLSGYCNNDIIKDLIVQGSANDDLTHDLLNLAVRYGSDDDITIITLQPTHKNFRKQSLFQKLQGIFTGH